MKVYDETQKLLGEWIPVADREPPDVSDRELQRQKDIRNLMKEWENGQQALQGIRMLEAEREELRKQREQCGWTYCYPPDVKERIKQIEMDLMSLKEKAQHVEDVLKSVRVRMDMSPLWQADPFEYPWYHRYIGPDLEGLL